MKILCEIKKTLFAVVRSSTGGTLDTFRPASVAAARSFALSVYDHGTVIELYASQDDVGNAPLKTWKVGR